jgi:hypothetical protein
MTILFELLPDDSGRFAKRDPEMHETMKGNESRFG